MFCQKCGNENDDTALFCKKCGQRLKNENDTPTTSSLSEEKVKKRKKSKWLYIGIPIVIVIILLIIGSSGGYDYVYSIQNAKPFTELDYTYEEVFEKYFDNLVWVEENMNYEGVTTTVYFEATVKGRNEKIFIPFDIIQSTEDSTKFKTEINSSSIGDSYLDADQTNKFMKAIFNAYNLGQDNIDDIIDSVTY